MAEVDQAPIPTSGCCVGSPLADAGFAEDRREDECCAPADRFPSCSLDGDGMVMQGARYREIGRSVLQAERSARSLAVTFSPTVDSSLVEETLRVERGCCEFFDLEFDPDRLLLTIAVPTETMAPALEAISSALGTQPTHRGTTARANP